MGSSGDILAKDGTVLFSKEDYGVQRIYRYGDYGLSVINSKIVHAFTFAWEAAVIHFDTEGKFELDYSTPLTDDVVVFSTDDDTNAFINRALDYFESLPIEKVRTAMRKVKDARRK